MRRLMCAACGVLAVLWTSVLLGEDPPATAPAEAQTLHQGEIVFDPPAGWKSEGKRTDDRSAGYTLPDKKALLVITVAPQQSTIPNALAPKLAASIQQAIRVEAQKGNIEIVDEPKVETDPRFLLKIHDRFRAKDRLGDRVQVFRGVGKNLVSVVVTAFTESADEARSIHEAGEQVMLSLRLSRADSAPGARQPVEPAMRDRTSLATTRPVVFREPRLRVPPPAGWPAQSTGAASGLIVTWRDPTDTTNLIALTYRPIPADAKRDDKLRDLAIEQIAAGEQPSFSIDGAELAGETQTIKDRRFLRKQSTEYRVQETRFRVGFRQVSAGDGVVSITSVALADKADEIDKLADAVATEVRATRE